MRAKSWAQWGREGRILSARGRGPDLYLERSCPTLRRQEEGRSQLKLDRAPPSALTHF